MGVEDDVVEIGIALVVDEHCSEHHMTQAEGVLVELARIVMAWKMIGEMVVTIGILPILGEPRTVVIGYGIAKHAPHSVMGGHGDASIRNLIVENRDYIVARMEVVVLTLDTNVVAYGL